MCNESDFSEQANESLGAETTEAAEATNEEVVAEPAVAE